MQNATASETTFASFAFDTRRQYGRLSSLSAKKPAIGELPHARIGPLAGYCPLQAAWYRTSPAQAPNGAYHVHQDPLRCPHPRNRLCGAGVQGQCGPDRPAEPGGILLDGTRLEGYRRRQLTREAHNVCLLGLAE